MVSSTSSSEALREKLVQAYRRLPPLEQLMVQIFSIIYEPVSRAVFVNCWNNLPERERGGKHFTIPSLRPYIEALLEKAVLVQSSNTGPQCHPLLVEIATRDALQAKHFEKLVEAVNKGFPIPRRWKDGPVAYGHDRQLIRDVRISLYRKNHSAIVKQLEEYYRYSYGRNQISIGEILLQICTNPFDPAWFRGLPPELYNEALVHILNDSIGYLKPIDKVVAMLREDILTAARPRSALHYALLLEQLLLRAELQAAQNVVEQIPTEFQAQLHQFVADLAFLQGDTAIPHYRLALQSLKSRTNKRKVYFSSISGLFFILALIQDGSPTCLAEAVEYCVLARQAKQWLSPIYVTLEHLVRFQQGDLSRKDVILRCPIPAHTAGNSVETLICSLCHFWADAEQTKTYLPRLLEPLCQDAAASGYLWMAKVAGELLQNLKPTSQVAKQAAKLLKPETGRSLLDLIQPQEAWELSLKALMGLKKAEAAAAKPEGNFRLAWSVALFGKSWSIQPREQSLNAKGEWSKGRPVALKRLKSSPEEFSYLTPQDMRVCSFIKSYNYGWGNKPEYIFAEKAITALVGHPYVFLEDAPSIRLEVAKGEPELLVKQEKNDTLKLQFVPPVEDNKEVLVVKETPTRIKVIEVTPEHRRIAEILGPKNQLVVPAAAKERVLAAIGAVSGIVTVHSDIGGGVAAEAVPSDPKPHIHLLPASTGLQVSVLVRPFASSGPYYRPGAGGATVMAEVEGKRLQTSRNLKDEKKLANAVIADCPILAESESSDYQWLLEDPEDCLELLLQLQALGDRVTIEQPEGERFRIRQQVGLGNFKLNIKQQNDWFATEGGVQIDNQQVLDMQQLMQLLDQTPSRFIPLEDGQFIALTQEFRRRLDELRSFSDRSGKHLRLHPLAAMAVEDWIDDVGELTADKHWKAHIKRLKELEDFEPQLPSTLQAELRDYQLDGFRWLARLAHWGVGACLADDMGLGKTLQSLAVILTRAPEGPTLVVAPTSVGMNWVSEAEKFAPTLNVLQFGSGDRQKLLDQLKPFDLLVCSYGLLQQEEVAEKLAKVQWQTIVLDEAQSIKNFATKRSQAAMNLQGGFKLITTGTPIENHLGELWNLFRFINPGLLGSLESFNQKFAIPIERYDDRQAKLRLKKLIQPFLLRRTKNQVLQELPSRTEILLQVELSNEEMAFYEALRREAMEKLTESDATAGAKHLQVLAEIMRLRRACCNTKLVRPEMALPSSKLQLFGEVLGELLDNKHKALVFSQFVDHLQIIRDYLEEQKIEYQYLDGSTPAAERKKRVNAFQAGQGDVFLISLKAGGTGLNLTAADYVLHMDPWWNPAVEDQASDRAHRIGQHRPVTIYRLVAKNTIEEKIVQLHQHKRDLADSLLEGAEMSGKMSTDELLQLISAG